MTAEQYEEILKQNKAAAFEKSKNSMLKTYNYYKERLTMELHRGTRIVTFYVTDKECEAALELIIEDMNENGFYIKVKKHINNVRYMYIQTKSPYKFSWLNRLFGWSCPKT